MKKWQSLLIIMIVFLVAAALAVIGDSSINFLSKGQADTLYCGVGNTCGNNTYINSTVTLGVTNGSDAIFNTLNVTGNLEAAVFNGSIGCQDIVGGTDGDYCVDGGGSGSGTVDDDWINETGDTLTGDLIIQDGVKIRNTGDNLSITFNGNFLDIKLG